MQVTVHPSKQALGAAAAGEGAKAISQAIAEKGHATIVVATGASQFEMLKSLVKADVDWSKVTAFHLDEYVGLASDHPASFRAYLAERFVGPIGNLKEFVPVEGDAPDAEAEVARLCARISNEDVDVCFAGIGENGHLAFNDPPADFDTEAPYLVVSLDDACRRQQMGEGWFNKLEDVPARAISMSIAQIMKASKLVLSVSDERKASAVGRVVDGPVTSECPASIVQRHPSCTLHLDPAAAAQSSRA